MKLSRKTLAIILSAIMVQSAVVTSAISVSAEDEVDTTGIVAEIPDDDPSYDDPVIIPDEQLYKDWSFILTDAGAMITRYVGNENDVEIPAYINEVPVLAIGANAFRDKITMKSVLIPDSVVSIGNNAFRNCIALETMAGGQGVTTIGNRAFENCKSLQSFVLMFDLSEVGIAAFKGCSQLHDIMLYKVKEVKPYTFIGCDSLAYINSVETVKVGEFAFYGCKELTSVTIIAGENIDEVMTIDPMAFGKCTSLRYVNFHWADKVEVRASAFFDCKSLESVYYSGSYERWNENVHISPIGNRYLLATTVQYRDMNVAELDETEKEMLTGETVQLTYHSAPYAEQEEGLNIVSWTSSNPEIATVDENGNVTAKSEGVAQIKLTSSSPHFTNYESYCIVIVKQSADSVELNKTAVNVGVGQKYTLKATVSPSQAPQTVKWSTSDEKLATVDENGVVTAKRTGTVTITATTENGKTATCKVVVKKAPESIALNKTELTLKAKTTYTFKKTLTPTNSATSYKWESSNPDVAKVYSNGKIVTLQPGTTVITVTTHNGKSASCTVTVK